MPDSDNKKRFWMLLINLRDDFILGHRTSIYPDAMALFEAWRDLSLDEKKDCKGRAERLIQLFINHLTGVGVNQFLEQYREAFAEEDASLVGIVSGACWNAELEADRIRLAGESFQEILWAIKDIPNN